MLVHLGSYPLAVELLARSMVDMLQLSEVIWVVSKRLSRYPHDPAVKAPTLQAIGDLLSGGFVIADDVKKDDDGLLCVHSWQLDAHEAVARIAKA